MKYKYIAGIIVVAIALLSFKGNPIKQESLIGTWQCIALETPTEDSFAEAQLQEHLLEVASWKSIPKEVSEITPTQNLDTAKKVVTRLLLEQKEEILKNKNEFIYHFQFGIKQDGLLERITKSSTDTANWYLGYPKDGRSILVLEPNYKAIMDKNGDLASFEIVSVTQEQLKLKVMQPMEYETYIIFKKVQ